MNTQPVVGANLMILDPATGYTGTVFDSRVSRKSNIFWVDKNGVVLSCPDDILENVRISPLILDDGGYPWLVISCSFSKVFSKALSLARATSECPFGILKAR